MLIKALETPNSRLLERAMDLAALRAEVLSHNIANLNTPNFKRSDVDFTAILAETLHQKEISLERTHRGHLSNLTFDSLKPRIIKETNSKERSDGNNVDVEFEMAQIAENSLYYQTLTMLWKKEMAKLKMAIQGRS
ncbi:MAG TPA: flagellar basal body rod protein FlgB [Bacillota bacterium]